MTGRRLDDLGAWTVRREALGEGRLDAVSRALTLAEPMSRRRAIGVVGAAVVAGQMLRPLAARAQGSSCPPSNRPADTKECSIPSGNLKGTLLRGNKVLASSPRIGCVHKIVGLRWHGRKRPAPGLATLVLAVQAKGKLPQAYSRTVRLR